MQDLVIWFGSGAVALVQLLVWGWIMPGASAPSPPSEYAAVVFFCLVCGELSLVIVSFISAMLIILGIFCGAGALIDAIFEKR